MLVGKYWIKPGGEAVSVAEHAEYGKRFLLRMKDEEKLSFNDLFTEPTLEQCVNARDRGATVDDVLSFKIYRDVRVYLLKEHGWIRVRANAFYIWDDLTLKHRQAIRQAASYWHEQTKLEHGEQVEIINVKHGLTQDVAVSSLRE